MTMTSRYGLNLIAESQSARVPANEFLLFLEAVKSGRVKSRTTTAQPGAPVDGDLYILPTTPTGAAWTGQGLKYAWRFNGAWRFYAFTGGDFVFVDDEQRWAGYNPVSSSWVDVKSTGTSLPDAAANVNRWLFSNGTAWVGQYQPAIYSWAFQQPNPTAVNATIVGYGAAIMTGANNLGFPVPATKTLVIFGVTMAVRAGAAVGTYTVDGVVQDGVGTQSVLCTGVGTANSDIRAGAENLATGIFALAGPNSVRIGWFNRASSVGPLVGAVTHLIQVSGLFI